MFDLPINNCSNCKYVWFGTVGKSFARWHCRPDEGKLVIIGTDDQLAKMKPCPHHKKR